MVRESKISAFFLSAQALLVVVGIAHNQSLLHQYEKNKNVVFFRELATRMGQADELLLPKESLPTTKYDPNAPLFNRNKIHRIVDEKWKGKDAKQIFETSQAIFEEAQRFGFDPYFLLAVVERESRFNPRAKGRHGEIGLMQIKPDTAQWISERYGFPWMGAESLYQPAHNVRLGAAYFDFLRRSFRSDGRLYLSAYNLGPKRTREVLRHRPNRSFYASEVIGNYLRLHHKKDENDNG